MRIRTLPPFAILVLTTLVACQAVPIPTSPAVVPTLTPTSPPSALAMSLNVEVVMNYECPFMVANYRKLMAKAEELSDRVEVTEYPLKERRDVEKYGEMNLYIDGEAPFFGPGKEEELERIIQEHLEKKGLA